MFEGFACQSVFQSMHTRLKSIVAWLTCILDETMALYNLLTLLLVYCVIHLLREVIDVLGCINLKDDTIIHWSNVNYDVLNCLNILPWVAWFCQMRHVAGSVSLLVIEKRSYKPDFFNNILIKLFPTDFKHSDWGLERGWYCCFGKKVVLESTRQVSPGATGLEYIYSVLYRISDQPNLMRKCNCLTKQWFQRMLYIYIYIYIYIYTVYSKVTLYFKVHLLQCNYTFKHRVILINYIYLLYG